MDHLVFDASTRAESSGLRSFHQPIEELSHHLRIAMPNVIKHFRELGYDVRRIATTGDDVMQARILGHMFAHQVRHEIHGLDGIERRATALGRGGGVCGHSVEAELRTFVGQRRLVGDGIAIAGVPMQCHIDIVEQSGAHHVGLAGTALLGGSAINADGAAAAIAREPILQRNTRRRRRRAKEMVPACMPADSATQR